MKFLINSLNNVLEAFVLSGLKASSLMKSLLKCVRTSSTAAFLNLSPLYTLVSKNVVDISTVILIEGWCLFACSMNLVISSL